MGAAVDMVISFVVQARRQAAPGMTKAHRGDAAGLAFGVVLCVLVEFGAGGAG
jgi:hypothetical protein